MRDEYSTSSRGLKGVLSVAVLGGTLMLEGCRCPFLNKDAREEYRSLSEDMNQFLESNPEIEIYINSLSERPGWMTDELIEKTRKSREEN